MTPTAQMSTATDWLGDLRRTSGGLKPGVPALAAWRWGRDRQEPQTVIWPGQQQEIFSPGLGPAGDSVRPSRAELQREVTLARNSPVTPEISVSWLWQDTSSIVKDGDLVKVGDGVEVFRSAVMMEFFVTTGRLFLI